MKQHAVVNIASGFANSLRRAQKIFTLNIVHEAYEISCLRATDAIVTGVTPNGNAGSLWVEVVTLAYSQLAIEAREQTESGSMAASVSAGWNVKENRAIA